MIDPNMTSGRKLKRLRSLLLAGLWACAVAAAVLSPSVARAQEEEVKHDARLDGYQSNVVVQSGDSTALTWLLLVFLGMVALGVMFKNAKRTHLD